MSYLARSVSPRVTPAAASLGRGLGLGVGTAARSVRRTTGLAVFIGVWTCALAIIAHGAETKMRAVVDPVSGGVDLFEDDQPVLRYNYRTVEPPDSVLEKVSAGSRKYARARSNYIHPLYGPEGEVLTEDWSVDHPHHRGIYWAWPEVDFGGARGDLHALQHVFARPTGAIELSSGETSARIEAENLWQWEDKTPIVRELATIIAHGTTEHGRLVDLKFQFTALEEGVKLARRGTDKYGGLNIRLSPVKGLQLVHHADLPNADPRRGWSDSVGVRSGGSSSVGLAVFESSTNPDYPGDYVHYPDLPWFQPTFPRAGTRYELKKGKPLTLRYRLWIRRGGQVDEVEYVTQWRGLNETKPQLP
ncbi:MAG TPA: DUF6807 family protein [Pirellulaceae bacterium]|nr:DUF6807 family protein [Pirellulaceae bacterium]